MASGNEALMGIFEAIFGVGCCNASPLFSLLSEEKESLGTKFLIHMTASFCFGIHLLKSSFNSCHFLYAVLATLALCHLIMH